ncbi:MAG: delta-class carbonic anhydrase [Paracoccus sp. (in: a-proteobacteria)]
MRKVIFGLGTAASLIAFPALAEGQKAQVPDEVIAAQRSALAATTEGKGFGPQSPRDIDRREGRNQRSFATAPDITEMTLCDIHLHRSAEHKGGEFTTYAGNGDARGHGTGFKYDGALTEAELAPVGHAIGDPHYGGLAPGDTIEIHFAHSTAAATLGHSLMTCLSDMVKNPQLRVEALIAVLVNDPNAADFTEIARIEEINSLKQVPNLPDDLGTPVVYDGSTTGPSHNETASPYQVTWSVRPRVLKININSVEAWLADNEFSEHHAHGVRNLVTNPDLLAPID